MSIEELLPKLIRAGFEADMKSLESLSITLVRKLKPNFPKLSEEVAHIIAYRNIGATTLRSIGVKPSPVDQETRFPLAQIMEPQEILAPILNESVSEKIDRFVKERGASEKLIKEGVRPPNSLLLYGPPGVGKTYLAKSLAYELNMTLITLDLATSISSYLGKTGQNIKSLLDYARSFNSILFLDEFDAIAKKRDDASDVGELKRIVNVLLKELESWPSHSIIIAATNHPELLDKAIWRRFDKSLALTLPEKLEREKIIRRELNIFGEQVDKIISIVTDGTKDISAADLCKYCEVVKRRYIIDAEDPKIIMISELAKLNEGLSPNDKVRLCCLLRRYLPKATIREISSMTGYSTTSVQRYLNKEL